MAPQTSALEGRALPSTASVDLEKCVEIFRVRSSNGAGLDNHHILVVQFSIFREVVTSGNDHLVVDDHDLVVHEIVVVTPDEGMRGRCYESLIAFEPEQLGIQLALALGRS